MSGEQHEAGLRTDYDKRVVPHLGTRAGYAIGKQVERIGVAELRLIEAHCHIVVTGKRHREFRPLRADGRRVLAQSSDDIEPHAVNMDVQLVLRTAHTSN